MNLSDNVTTKVLTAMGLVILTIIIAFFIFGPTFSGPGPDLSCGFSSGCIDLEVETLILSPTNPVVGDTVTFTALVKNIGDTAAGPFTVNMRLDDELIGQNFRIDGLEPGQTVPVESTLVFSERDGHFFHATADVNDEVDEPFVLNNKDTVVFQVR